VTGVSPVDWSPKEDIMAIRFNRTALVAGVKGQEAGAFAAEMCEYVTQAWGIPLEWGMQVGGTNGMIHWFMDYEDMAAFEAGVVRSMTDPGYLAVLAKAEGLFIEGSTKDTIIYMM
jgi:hypothetical protein